MDFKKRNKSNLKINKIDFYFINIFNLTFFLYIFAEQIHKQHDNFIKHKNQCNKPMKLITQNMTCQPQQQQHQMQQTQQQQPIIINNSNNMCQKLAVASKEKSSFINDEIDGISQQQQTSVELKTDTNDNLNHKSLLSSSSPTAAALTSTTPSSISTTTSSTKSATSLLKSSKPGSAATVPRCSQSLTNHNIAATKYGSNKLETSTETATNTMTLDKQQNILSNKVLSQIQQQPSASSSTSSEVSASTSLSSFSAFKQPPNDTSIDKSNNHLLTATGLAKKKVVAAVDTTNRNNKLAALDNLDLALNLSNLPLEGDEDDDPYFELQEYLERVKVSL